jgi:hypothetical protein
MVMHPDSAANTKVGRGFPLPILASLALLTAACMPAVQTDPKVVAVSPELYEFANMRQSNMIPKSSPAAFERGFESFCINGGSTAASVAAKLRKTDYVAAPNSTPSGQTAFVVDDTRPMVVISDDGRFCGVLARSRTGQTARVQRFIAKRFPKATQIDQSLAGYEMLLQTNSKPAGLIALKRLTSGVAGSRLLLSIQRPS